MRKLAALALLGIIGAAPMALAESWRAKPVLEPGAPPNCQEADVSNLFFDLAETGNELSVKSSSGEVFSAPIAADGYVKTTLSVPVGNAPSTPLPSILCETWLLGRTLELPWR